MNIRPARTLAGRYLIVLSIASSLLLVSIFAMRSYIVNQDIFSVLLITLSFSNAFLIAIVCALFYENIVQRNLARVQSAASTQAFRKSLLELREIFNSRTKLSAFFSELYLTGTSDVDVVDGTRSYILDLLNRSKAIFDAQTQDDCSVCIKLLADGVKTPFAEEAYITQVLRDTSSSMRRQNRLPSDTLASSNTAFKYILSSEPVGYYYFNNNLFHSNLLGDYKNPNENWYYRYNAIAVCAIKDPDRENPDDVIGFLCVDNFKGNFDTEITCNTLRLLSTSIFYVYRNLELLQKKGQLEFQALELKQ